MRPVGLDRWVAGWFRQQLGSVWGIGRDDGEPEVVTDWNVVVRGEAEYVGVAPECCSLVVYAARGLLTESIEAFP